MQKTVAGRVSKLCRESGAVALRPDWGGPVAGQAQELGLKAKLELKPKLEKELPVEQGPGHAGPASSTRPFNPGRNVSCLQV
jgi:hypothetical protein